MSTLDKCNGSCNSVNASSAKIKQCVPSKTKCVNVEIINMITKINEAKSLIKLSSCKRKLKFNSTTCNSNQKWNSET